MFTCPDYTYCAKDGLVYLWKVTPKCDRRVPLICRNNPHLPLSPHHLRTSSVTVPSGRPVCGVSWREDTFPHERSFYELSRYQSGRHLYSLSKEKPVNLLYRSQPSFPSSVTLETSEVNSFLPVGLCPYLQPLRLSVLPVFYLLLPVVLVRLSVPFSVPGSSSRSLLGFKSPFYRVPSPYGNLGVWYQDLFVWNPIVL